jgi:hypothetical protein
MPFYTVTVRPFLVFFLSVLRQFKIVKPTRQQALKTKLPLHVVWTSNKAKI